VGGYQTVLSSQYYNSKQTVTDIKQSLLNNVHTALTDMNGGELYQPVDVIKMVVKQLRGFKRFKSEDAHSLTIAAITACNVYVTNVPAPTAHCPRERTRLLDRYTSGQAW